MPTFAKSLTYHHRLNFCRSEYYIILRVGYYIFLLLLSLHLSVYLIMGVDRRFHSLFVQVHQQHLQDVQLMGHGCAHVLCSDDILKKKTHTHTHITINSYFHLQSQQQTMDKNGHSSFAWEYSSCTQICACPKRSICAISDESTDEIRKISRTKRASSKNAEPISVF
jgi:hypothetical protein